MTVEMRITVGVGDEGGFEVARRRLSSSFASLNHSGGRALRPARFDPPPRVDVPRGFIRFAKMPGQLVSRSVAFFIQRPHFLRVTCLATARRYWPLVVVMLDVRSAMEPHCVAARRLPGAGR